MARNVVEVNNACEDEENVSPTEVPEVGQNLYNIETDVGAFIDVQETAQLDHTYPPNQGKTQIFNKHAESAILSITRVCEGGLVPHVQEQTVSTGAMTSALV